MKDRFTLKGLFFLEISEIYYDKIGTVLYF